MTTFPRFRWGDSLYPTNTSSSTSALPELMPAAKAMSKPGKAAGGCDGGDRGGGGNVGGEGGFKGGGDVGGGEGVGGSGGGGEGAKTIKTARATDGFAVIVSPVAALSSVAFWARSFISTAGRSVMDDTVASHTIVAVTTTEAELIARVTRESATPARVATLLL